MQNAEASPDRQGGPSAQFPLRPPALDLGFSEPAAPPFSYPSQSMKGLRDHPVLHSPASSRLRLGAQRLRDLEAVAEWGLEPGHLDSQSSVLLTLTRAPSQASPLLTVSVCSAWTMREMGVQVTPKNCTLGGNRVPHLDYQPHFTGAQRGQELFLRPHS